MDTVTVLGALIGGFMVGLVIILIVEYTTDYIEKKKRS